MKNKKIIASLVVFFLLAAMTLNVFAKKMDPMGPFDTENEAKELLANYKKQPEAPKGLRVEEKDGKWFIVQTEEVEENNETGFTTRAAAEAAAEAAIKAEKAEKGEKAVNNGYKVTQGFNDKFFYTLTIEPNATEPTPEVKPEDKPEDKPAEKPEVKPEEKPEDKKGKQTTIDDYNKADETELGKAKKELTNRVNGSEYLTADEKVNFVDEISKATLYDALEVLPKKIDKAEAEGRKAALAALDGIKAPLLKEIYESKLSDEFINNLYSRVVKAETKAEVEALEKEFKALVKGEITEPTKPAVENDKKAEVKEDEGKKAEEKVEEKAEAKKEAKANTPATGSNVVLAAITFGVSALGTVVTAAKRK